MDREGTSSGKVILLGEHAVVHGAPALAASIGRGARARARPSEGEPALRVTDASGPWVVEPGSELDRAFQVLHEIVGVSADAQCVVEIPARAGLGSSACLGVALARALLTLRGVPVDDTTVVEAATAWERVFHGNPSGIDVAVAVHGGCIRFSRSRGVKPMPLSEAIPLCVGDTGLRSSTREMVDRVAAELAARGDAGRGVLAAIGACVERAAEALPRAAWDEVAGAMRDNHGHLRDLGLSNPTTETLCSVATSAGALAAKITGAGGGGCVVALAPGRQQAVLDAWAAAGFTGFSVCAGCSRRT